MENLPANRSPMRPTISYPEQKAAIAKQLLAAPTTSTEASKAAKNLVGQWANLKPDNPGVFITSIAAVLSKYPLALVDECVDPRVGAATKIEFLSIASLTAWCDGRLEHYRALAQWKPPALPPPQLPDDPLMAERVRQLLVDLASVLRAKGPSPLDQLHEERAEARKLRIAEVMRHAYGEAAE